MQVVSKLVFLIVWRLLFCYHGFAHAFAAYDWSRGMCCRRRIRCSTYLMSSQDYPQQCLFGVSDSGWKSPVWNWGSAVGTGHDCAKICRQQYSTRRKRQELVQQLLTSQGTGKDIPQNFEEVKLILALAWQRGRWDGTDGGKGGYSEVLQHLVAANRYEVNNESHSDRDWSLRWIDDIQQRYHLLRPSSEQLKTMQEIVESVNIYSDSDSSSICDDSVIYRARRQCSGLVLEAMGFIENGC